MGIFNELMTKIFHAGAYAEKPPDAAAPAVPRPIAAAPAAAVLQEVDVAAILDKLAAASRERLDWKHSIVDLMKLVNMDSSLAARKALAADLKFAGDTSDTAAMNIWLHGAVMKKLAENGGKIPAALLPR